MSKLYRIDVRIVATAYVRADSAAQARELVKAMHNESGHLTGDQVSGEPFNSPRLPDVSLSPAVTIGLPMGRATRVED